MIVWVVAMEGEAHFLTLQQHLTGLGRLAATGNLG
jgi:hypothetical protein